jgi:hypothetical protein
MNFIGDTNFDSYVDKYKNLPLKEKKALVEKEFEELLVVLNALNEKYNNASNILINREIFDLKKTDATEDDFVEAIFVYSHSIKELIASIINGLEK